MSSVPPQVTFTFPSTDSLSSGYREGLFPRALSPTSSVIGCFVRSRPTSPDFSDCGDYTDFSALSLTEQLERTVSSSSSEEEDSTVDDIVLKATSNWARDKIIASDARSIMAPSVLTTASRSTIVPVRIIRRSPGDIIDDPPAAGGEDKSRRRTWPSYKKIRKTVTSILQRKDIDRDRDAKSPAPEVKFGKLKSSSASLFTKKRRVTVGEMDSPASRSRIPRALSIRTHAPPKASLTRAELRRSHSFAGFTSALPAIDDADDDDVDEVTAEARGVVEAIGRRWAFEEVEEGEWP